MKNLGVFILFCLFSIQVFSQKKVLQTKPNPLELALVSLERAYSSGDYERAFQLAVRLNIALNSYQNKQRVLLIKENSRELLKIRYEAYRAIREGKSKLASEKYTQILARNPNDTKAREDREKLSFITEFKRDNVLDKALSNTQKIFLDGINASSIVSQEERIEKILRAKKNWVAIAKTTSAYKSEEIQKNILAANEIVDAANMIQQYAKNGQVQKANKALIDLELKYPEAKGFLGGIVKSSAENRKNYFTWKHEAEKAFCEQNYVLVLKKIKDIKTLDGYAKDSYVRFNGRKLDVETILNAKSDIEKLKYDLGKTDMILANYEIIMRKNPCDKDEYYEFVKTNFLKNYGFMATYNTCDNMIKYGMLLIKINEKKAEIEGVQEKINTCDTKVQCLEKCRNLYLPSYHKALALKNRGQLKESKNILLSGVLSSESKLIECHCDSIVTLSKSLIIEVEKGEKQLACIENAQSVLAQTQMYKDENLLEKGLLMINSVDTVCLSTFPKILANVRQERKYMELMLKEKIYTSLRDSALRQENHGYFKDLFALLLKAKENAPDDARLAGINGLIMDKCCLYKNISSTEKSDLCSICNEGNCCPESTVNTVNLDSSKINTIDIRFGGLLQNGNLNISNTNNGERSKLAYPPAFGVLLGAKIQRLNFTKIYDWSIGLDISYTKIAISKFSNGLGYISGEYSPMLVLLPMEMKWHARKTYHEIGRIFVSTGLLLAKNILFKYRSNTSFDLTPELTALNAGYRLGVGYEIHKKKSGMTLEVNYNGLFSIYKNGEIANRTNYNNFSYISLGLGIRIK